MCAAFLLNGSHASPSRGPKLPFSVARSSIRGKGSEGLASFFEVQRRVAYSARLPCKPGREHKRTSSATPGVIPVISGEVCEGLQPSLLRMAA